MTNPTLSEKIREIFGGKCTRRWKEGTHNVVCGHSMPCPIHINLNEWIVLKSMQCESLITEQVQKQVKKTVEENEQRALKLAWVIIEKEKKAYALEVFKEWCGGRIDYVVTFEETIEEKAGKELK